MPTQVAGWRRAAPMQPAGMPDDPKVIRFPGLANAKPATAKSKEAAPQPDASVPDAPAIGPDGLTEDQRKAVQVVLGGMSFVLIGIKPTDRGADFFTAVHGDAGELRNAQPHLDGVIARAFSRKGL